MYKKPKAYKIRQHAIQMGRLVEVTEEAKQLGYPCQIAFTSDLWQSLVFQSPGENAPSDHLEVSDILEALLPRFLDEVQTGRTTFYFQFEAESYWLSRISFKVHLVYAAELMAATVYLPGEGYAVPSTLSPAALPSSLLYQLEVTLRSLGTAFRHTDLQQLRLVQQDVARLVDSHPLHHELRQAVSSAEIKVPFGSSREAYRKAGLDSLHHLLGRLLSCGSHLTELRNVQARLDAIRSPLSDLAHLARDMLELTAYIRTDTVDSAIVYNPLDPLLILFSDLHSRLEKAQLDIPRETFSAIQLQLELMRPHLPEDLVSYVAYLESRFAQIQQHATLSALPATPRPSKDTWH